MKKNTKKMGVIVFICLSLMIFNIPFSYALENDIKSNNLNSKVVVQEVEELREEFSKHYLNTDGTITAVTYNDTIHYQDKDGKWKNIDNTLIEKQEMKSISKNVNDYIAPNDNPLFDIKFNKKASSNSLFNVSIDNHYLNFNIENANDVNAVIKNNNTENFSTFALNDITSDLTYKNIFDSSDIEFEINSTRLLTKIILNEKPRSNKIKFSIKTDLIAEQDEHGLIFFFDKNKKAEKYILQVPYLFDNAEKTNSNDNVKVELTASDDGYIVTYTLDNKYLESKEVEYPISVYASQSVTNEKYRQNILDTYVHPGDSSGDHVNSDRLYVGKREGGSRAYINWKNFPSINGTINSAYLDFNFMPGTGSWGGLDIARVNNSWTSSSINYNISTSLGYTTLYSNVTPTLKTYQNFYLDITDTARGWYNGSIGRNGFMIKYTNENYNDYNSIISGDSSLSSSYWPGFAINYSTSTPKPNAYVGYYYSTYASQGGNNIFNGFVNAGYSTSLQQNPSKNDLISSLSDSVTAYVGHGNYSSILVGDNGFNYMDNDRTEEGSYTSEHETPKTRYTIGLGRFNLSSMKLMILAACKTADYYSDSYPISRRVTDYFGAQSSIGWEQSAAVKAMAAYLKDLGYGLATGKSIQGSIDYANSFSTIDDRVRKSYAWGNTALTINVSSYARMKYFSENESRKEPIEYNVQKEYNNVLKSKTNKVLSPQEFAVNYIKNNLNSNFNINDYKITTTGRSIIFTYTPLGIKTENVYTALVEDNIVTKITSYVDDNFENLKQDLEKVKFLNDEQESLYKNTILSQKDKGEIKIYESGYIYKDRIIYYYVTYDVNSNGLLFSDTELFAI